MTSSPNSATAVSNVLASLAMTLEAAAFSAVEIQLIGLDLDNKPTRADPRVVVSVVHGQISVCINLVLRPDEGALYVAYDIPEQYWTSDIMTALARFGTTINAWAVEARTQFHADLF